MYSIWSCKINAQKLTKKATELPKSSLHFCYSDTETNNASLFTRLNLICISQDTITKITKTF